MNDANRGSQTWSRGGLEAVPACPACGDTRRKGAPLTCSDHRTELPDTWTLHRCANCRSLYLDPRPDAESLPRAYEAYYTHDENDERVPTSGLGAVLWRLVHGYLNHRFGMNRQPASRWGVPVFTLLPPLRLKLDYYGRHLHASAFPQRGRLLDVGCGNGAFLARAREMGWEASGLEPDPQAVATCRQQSLDVTEGVLATAPASWSGQFDVVTMSHAIEHVPEPGEDLKRILLLLKPGGMLWIALPNPRGWGARFYGGAWRELHPPYHLCITARNQLADILRAAGFVQLAAHRLGTRNKRAVRESAENARHAGDTASHIKAACAPLIRVLADTTATLSAGGGEETVLTARRPPTS